MSTPPTPSARPLRRRPGLAAAVGVGAVAILIGVANSAGWVGRAGGGAGFRVLVASGEPVVARGGSVTLSGYAEPTAGPCDLPEAAELVCRDGANGPFARLPMTGNGAGAFHATRAGVEADFQYRVEAGGVASGWHRVLVADPAEADDRSTARVTPPAYSAAPPAEQTGLSRLAGPQHAVAALALRFTRPAETAYLDWRPDGRPADARILPVALDPDGDAGTATFPLTEDGTLRVVLVSGYGPRRLTTERAVPVRVTPDAPPRFDQVTGVTPRPLLVAPGGRLTVGAVVADDLGVTAVELEYLAGPGPAVRVPLPLTGAGTPRAAGRVVFDLAGLGVEGDTIRFRLRATDGRRVDAAKLGPQETTYPAAGWAEVWLAASAPPADRQEVLGRRDFLRDALRGALADLTAAVADVDGLPPPGDAPSAEHALRSTTAREKVRAAADHLRAAAAEAELAPDLRSLADGIRAAAGEPLRVADEAVGRSADAADRLRAVAGRVEELYRRNDRAARARLDRDRLTALAAEQAALAGSTAPAADRRRAQVELLAKLTAVVGEGDGLRRGFDVAAVRDARLLAAEARAVAKHLEELDAAAADLAAGVRRPLLDELGRAHAALADRAAGILLRVGTAARLARVTLPPAEGFARAADALAADEPLEALVELETVAAALDRAADEFDRLAAERADPRAAARQLVGWQQALRERLTGGEARTLLAEQQALARAVDRLDLPAGGDPERYRAAAADHLRRAVRAVGGNDGTAADAAMKAVADALHRAAEVTPPAAERRAEGRRKLDTLRAEQEAVGTAVEAVVRVGERYPIDAAGRQLLAARLARALDLQQKLVTQVVALDLPGHRHRLGRATAAATAAAADLRAGLPLDALASLAWSKRELDRLRAVCDGSTPADEEADDLAVRQRGVADGGTAAAQQEIGRRLGALTVAESPALLEEAREAVRLAEGGFRDGVKPDTRARRTRAAADRLALLADRVNAREPDRDRVRRLADARRRAVETARAVAGRSANPDASQEARRQLGREVEELTFTRVGAAGQPVKRRAFELYDRLKGRPEPDRDAGLQGQLADSLDELAGAMAGRADLSARVAPPPRESDPAEGYLATPALAAAVRDLAARVRETRGPIGAVEATTAARLRPVKPNPFAPLVRRQRELAEGVQHWAGTRPTDADAVAGATAAILAADQLAVGRVAEAAAAGAETARRVRPGAADLARTQELILKEFGTLADPRAVAAQQAARGDELSAHLLGLADRFERTGTRSPAGEAVGRSLVEAAGPLRAAGPLVTAASPARAEAVRLIRAAADGVTAPLPPDPALDAGERVAGSAARRADRAMRVVVELLEAGGGRRATDRAMRTAADELTRTAAAVAATLADR